MLIFHPVNWIESEFSVSFVRIKLGVIKRVFFLPFLIYLCVCKVIIPEYYEFNIAVQPLQL